MRRIVLPLITPSFLGGWVFIFLLSAKELSMSVLLVSPQTPVVSVAIFELWENAQVGELAAFGVIWTAILVSVAILYYASRAATVSSRIEMKLPQFAYLTPA